MMLGALAAVVVAIGMLLVYDRGYAKCAEKYEATYRDAIDKHRAEQARERGRQVLEELRAKVRSQARDRAAGKAAW